ncbi:hypothetical protein MED01_002365 [Micromonospora sp. MED01]|uniref:hypothetical protein n=1 Tax=Micromonospora alfalfae TaxID=2911212 RepID=UPI001EE936F1|nr:hypothetical protein [Micromonospora alfalfae]MCG5464200.1 hypothetical protein [Micromonospora alfalfae]
MTGQPYTDTDVEHLTAAVRVRAGWPASAGEAGTIVTITLDALTATDRLLPEPTAVTAECDIDWTDLRSSRPGADVQARSYEWPADEFDALLATEIRAAELFHRAPVRIRKRTVKAYADGSKLVGAWTRVELPTDV